MQSMTAAWWTKTELVFIHLMNFKALRCLIVDLKQLAIISPLDFCSFIACIIF